MSGIKFTFKPVNKNEVRRGRRRAGPEDVRSSKDEVRIQRMLERGVISREQLGPELWRAADILRGAVRPERYASYVLPLLFFKRLSDVSVDEYRKAVEEYGSEEVARAEWRKLPLVRESFIPHVRWCGFSWSV
jgi:type I restriction enzyme M protein